MKKEYLLLFKGVDSYYRVRGGDLSDGFHRDLVGCAIEDSFRLAYELFDIPYPSEIRKLRDIYNEGGHEVLEAMLEEIRQKEAEERATKMSNGKSS